MGDLNVRQVTPSHPLLDATERFLESGSQFAFGEEFFPSVRNGRRRHRCSTMVGSGVDSNRPAPRLER